MSSGVLLRSRRHWGDSASEAGRACGSAVFHRSLFLGHCTRLVADAVMLNAALALALLLRYLWIIMAEWNQQGGRVQELGQRYVDVYLELSWIVTLIGLTALWLSGLYTYARSYRVRHKALFAAQAVSFAFGLSGVAVYLIGQAIWVPRGVLPTAWAIAVVLVVTSRVWSAIWRHMLANESSRSDTAGSSTRPETERHASWQSDTPASAQTEAARDVSWWSDTAGSGRIEAAGNASRRDNTAAFEQAETSTEANRQTDRTAPLPAEARSDAVGWRRTTATPAQVERPPDASRPTGAPGTGRVKVEGREKTVLVVGGAGYIGSALLPKLLHQGYRVRVLDLFLYGFGPIAKGLDNPAVEIIRADFRQIDALVRAMQGVDHLVHLGGIVGDPACAIDEELTIDVNVAATRLVGEVAKGDGIKHFLFASTCSVYGESDSVLSENSALNPLSFYARSKLASERVLLGMADDTFTPTILRFGTIYGLSGRTRFDLVVNLLAAKAAFEGRISVFGGDQWRPFLHVDDAALAVTQLLNLPPGRGADVFNVGSNQENYTIAQVAEIVRSVVPEAELAVEAGNRDQRNYRVNFSKIQIMIEFEPRWTVEIGVRQIVNAIRAGEITDYREMRYSNEKYLTEMNGNGLAPPQIRWAHDLVRQSAVPAGGGR